MSLVDYSDSDDGPESQELTRIAPGPIAHQYDNHIMPDLPLDFQEAPTESIGEKIRNVPHVPGNWATLVYIEIESLEMVETLDELYNHLFQLNPNLHPIQDDLGYHLSLSRTVYLKVYHIEPFVELLRTGLESKRTFLPD